MFTDRSYSVTQQGFNFAPIDRNQKWKAEGDGAGTDLVPVAVMLCWTTVILKDFGDGALIDALQTELPLPQL